MNELLRLTVGLCLLRRGPQDLPYAPGLARGLLLLCLLGGAWYADVVGIGNPWPRLLLSLTLLVGVPWLLLGWRQRRERYVQTLTALALAELLFTALFLPLALLAQQFPLPPSPEQIPPQQFLLGWLVLALFGWKLLVNAHVLRHALELPRGFAVMLALSWFLLEFGLDRALFGGLE